jgi:hypothetical protein
MQITQMKYAEYLSTPEISKEYNDLFEINKNNFKKLGKNNGIDKEHLELISIKVASVETDFYFTDRLKKLEAKKK